MTIRGGGVGVWEGGESRLKEFLDGRDKGCEVDVLLNVGHDMGVRTTKLGSTKSRTPKMSGVVTRLKPSCLNEPCIFTHASYGLS